MTATHWYLLGLASGAAIALIAVALCVIAIVPDLTIYRRRLK